MCGDYDVHHINEIDPQSGYGSINESLISARLLKIKKKEREKERRTKRELKNVKH